jgi:hypothetical protein
MTGMLLIFLRIIPFTDVSHKCCESRSGLCSSVVSIVCIGCGKLLLVFASTVILGSESRWTHDHILLSQLETAWVGSGRVNCC